MSNNIIFSVLSKADDKAVFGEDIWAEITACFPGNVSTSESQDS